MGERASGAPRCRVRRHRPPSSVDFAVIRDTTPPTLTLEAVVQATDVHVTWNVEDSGSGVDASTCLLEVREDEGTWASIFLLGEANP